MTKTAAYMLVIVAALLAFEGGRDDNKFAVVGAVASVIAAILAISSLDDNNDERDGDDRV